MENLNIIHEPEKQRFILTIQDETAHVAYRIESGQGYQIVATCAYAVRWLQRHPEYEGKPSDEYCAGNACAL